MEVVLWSQRVLPHREGLRTSGHTLSLASNIWTASFWVDMRIRRASPTATATMRPLRLLFCAQVRAGSFDSDMGRT